MSAILALLMGTKQGGVPTPTLDSITWTVTTNTCSGSGCGTTSGCSDPGQAHRFGWDHTDCNDTNHHVAAHESKNGGAYVEKVDNLGCNQAGNDCSDPCLGGCEGYYDFKDSRCGGADVSPTYQGRIRIENDGTDTAVATITEGSSETENEQTDECLL